MQLDELMENSLFNELSEQEQEIVAGGLDYQAFFQGLVTNGYLNPSDLPGGNWSGSSGTGSWGGSTGGSTGSWPSAGSTGGSTGSWPGAGSTGGSTGSWPGAGSWGA